MAILVAGGAGYIGSHVCLELLTSDYDVIVVDNFSNSNKRALANVEALTKKSLKVYAEDILDESALEKIFSDNEIEAVIHLAGLKSVESSVKTPLKYYENNLTGTLVLCKVMQRFGVKKMVFSSSATVYGLNCDSPLTEEAPLNPTNPYGRSKLMIEELLRDVFASGNSWSISILRYFNPIGAHKSGKIGEDPKGIPTNIMPIIAEVAVGNRDYLTIFGDDYDTHDGTGVRDYIHVVDLAKGHINALEKILESSSIAVYNLGTGKGYSVLELCKCFENVTGQSIPFKIIERRAGDIGTCFADPTKARRELNWVTEKTLQDMCIDSWRWQRDNPNGYFKG